MPSYEVKLPTGEVYSVDSTHELTDDQAWSYVKDQHESSQQPAPESTAAGSFVRGVGSKVGEAGGVVGGAIGGAELGAPLGPFGIIGGGIIGGLAGGWAGDKAQEAVQGEKFTAELKAQRAIDAQQHGPASAMGELTASIPAMFVAPELSGGKILSPLAKLGATAAEAAAPLSKAATIGQHVVNAALGGSVMSAGEAGAGVQRGDIAPSDVPGAIVKGALTTAPLGAIKTPASLIAKVLGKAPADAATMAVTNSLYDHMTGRKDFDPSTLKDTTLQNMPGFMALNLLTGLIRGHAAAPKTNEQGIPESHWAEKPLEPVNAADTVANEQQDTMGRGTGGIAPQEVLPVAPQQEAQSVVEAPKKGEGGNTTETPKQVQVEPIGRALDQGGFNATGEIPDTGGHSGDAGALPADGGDASFAGIENESVPPPADSGGVGGTRPQASEPEPSRGPVEGDENPNGRSGISSERQPASGDSVHVQSGRGGQNQAGGEDSLPLKNSVTNRLREAAGLPPIEPGKPYTVDQMEADAKTVIAHDPDAAAKLYADLKANPRSPTAIETKILEYSLGKLSKSFDAASKEVTDAYDSHDKPRWRQAVEAHDLLLKRVGEETELYNRVGTKQSEDFRARQGIDGLLSDENGVRPLALELQGIRARKGGIPLTEAEVRSATAKHNEYVKDREDKARNVAKQEAATHKGNVDLVRNEAAREVQAEKQAEAKKTGEQKTAEKKAKREAFIAEMDRRADEALKSFREKMQRSNSDFAALAALPEVAQFLAARIAKGGAKVANLIEDLVAHFGITDKEAQKTAIANAQKLHDQQKAAFNKPEVTPESILKNAKAGDKLDGKLVKDLYKAHIKANLEKPLTREALEEKVFADVRAAHPDASDKAIRDEFSDYMKVKHPSKDELKRQLAEMGTQSRWVSRMEELITKGITRRFGPQFRAKSETVKEMITKFRDKMRELGIKTTRKEQLADAQSVVVNRLKGQIAELTGVLNGRLVRPDGKPIEDTPQIKELRKHRDELSAYLSDLMDPSKESKWNTNAQKAAEASQKAYELKIKTNDFGRAVNGFEANQKTKAAKEQATIAKQEFDRLREASGLPAAEANERLESRLVSRQAALKRELSNGEEHTVPRLGRPMSETNKIIKAENDRLSSILKWLRPADRKARDPLTPEQRSERAEKTAEKTIADLEREIAGEEKVRPDGILPNAKLRALKAEIESLRGIRDEMREAKFPRRTEDEVALDQYKKRLRKSTYDYEKRVREGDYGGKTRESIALDKEAQGLQYKQQQSRHAWEKEKRKIEMSNLSREQKIANALVGWRRAFVLSGYHVLGKLSAAAIARHISTPLDELAGSVLRKLPGVRDVAAKAPRHGSGFDVQQEAKAIAHGFTTMMKNSGDILRTGQTPSDAHSGKNEMHDLEHYTGKAVGDFFGHLHVWLKSSAKEAEYSRALQKRIEHELANNRDPHDPFTMIRLSTQAYQDAKAAVFQQKNFVTDGWKSLLHTWENSKAHPRLGKAAAAAGRILLPITTVPTNFIGEAINRTPVGLIRGAMELRGAIKKGLDSIHPEEADKIMRHLKQGSVGTGLMLLGYLAPQIAGGYYQSGEKRRKDDLKPGDIGFQHSHVFMHNTAAEVITMGATVRKVADHMLQGHPEGFIRGSAQAFLGLAGQTPFIRSPGDVSTIMNGRRSEQTRALGNMAQGMFLPRLSIEAAQDLDSAEKRRMRTVPDYFKAGIPVLRETLSVKP